MLVFWNTVVKAMHLMLAAEHVLCQSSLNSSLRHCSSTGFLSNQLDDCSLGLNHKPQRAKGWEQARLQTLRRRLEANRLLYVISWGQQSPGHVHQAVLLGTQQATNWHSKQRLGWTEGCKLRNCTAHQQQDTACQSTSCRQRKRRGSLLCRSLVTKQLRLLMPPPPRGSSKWR